MDKGMVFQSRWNNVNIYPIFDLRGKNFLNVEGYNVEYPKGNPWKNGEVKITYHHEPLEIERPPVPTLEELGLAQFWAEHDVIIEKEQ